MSSILQGTIPGIIQQLWFENEKHKTQRLIAIIGFCGHELQKREELVSKETKL